MSILEETPRKRTIRLFKENKKLDEFNHFAQRILDYKVTIKTHTNPKYAAATFSSTANLSVATIIVNTTLNDNRIKNALDHEITHLDQQATLLEKGFIKTDFNRKTQIAYELLTEAHAYSIEEEFSLKRDLQSSYSENDYTQKREENLRDFFAQEDQERLDIYLDQAIGNSRRSLNINKDMPLSLAASTLRVGNQEFMPESRIQDILRIGNLSDITDRFIERSPLKEEFKARIAKLES